ncbi:protein-export chaperone SecB [Algibacter pacificus]|uniref:protein-export chaperone SecB n=1 Tax=Algibacter pacificus TaxID=2599389 RepID=UPI001C9C5893|nr:protein-export chaperone SecB [Algibacter pacificus]
MFKLDKDISEEFKLSDFPKINAPAIAFPYLRAYISNLTLQSGFEPVMLPSINFVNLAKEKE